MKKIKTVQNMAKKIKCLQKIVVCEHCGKVMFVRVNSIRRLCLDCIIKNLHTQEVMQKQAESHSKCAKSYHKKQGNKYVHREVAEAMLGRPLEPGEIVHHRDGNPHNNDPENLMVMTQSEHMKLHNQERRERKAQLALACATI